MVKSLPEAGCLAGTWIIATGLAGKSWRLATLPTADAFNLSLALVVPNVEAITGGADIGTQVAVDTTVSQTTPVR